MPEPRKTRYHRQTTERLLMSARGPTGSGKTHFALTAPGPMAYLDINDGLEGVVEEFLDDGLEFFHLIYPMGEVVRSKVSEKAKGEKYNALWSQFIAETYAHMADPGTRTVVWDTNGEVWELARLAHFGRLDKVLAREYGPVNTEIQAMIHAFHAQQETNLIILAHEKEIYKDDKPTGVMMSEGYKGTDALMQVNLTMTNPGPHKFVATVVKSRLDDAASGMKWLGENIHFADIAEACCPGTDSDLWLDGRVE